MKSFTDNRVSSTMFRITSDFLFLRGLRSIFIQGGFGFLFFLCKGTKY
ncbi:hypothetical protein ADIS_4023 [Lunatimonas lonarensis]|uniref:Uncharacterized protein n=1 Tax=Lunatimonas lonarensis TaxID=1232681 RepID=R7ZNE2_9BACT|nr:hypothetical protein ADIS_4023 [Lunatimonas lonarensis]